MSGVMEKPIAFAAAYFVLLVVCTGIYCFMPDTDFYHQSIKNEPASVARRKALTDALGGALEIDINAGGPSGASVSYVPPYELAFPDRDYVSFTVGYYYYLLNADQQQWATLTSRCGPSERPKNFYERTLTFRMRTAASIGGRSITVRGQAQQLTDCDLDVLRLHYRSVERTREGFQAVLPITPDVNSLIETVSEEQMGYAPRSAFLDRLSRMFYFSVSALTTTGFGDILPLTAGARLLASLESIGGIVLAGLFVNALFARSRVPR
jgi:hypothetical protein